MKAVTQDRYGGPEVLQLREIEKPVPAQNEVLVRVHAAAIQAGDWHMLRGLPYVQRLMGTGILKPKWPVPGEEVAGVVEAVGDGVTTLRPGDEVFGTCRGALAEFACARADQLVGKPADISFEQAAATTASAMVAVQGVRDFGKVTRGRRVLIDGASGGVGTFAVQIAKALGAEVTGVCSTGKVDLVRSLGVDQVIDYTREDYTRSGERYDVLIDNASNHTLSECTRALADDGRYVLIGVAGIPVGRFIGAAGRFVKAPLYGLFVRQTMTAFVGEAKREDLLALKDFLEARTVRPVIDGTYPLSEARPAYEYVGLGHARGKVVVTIGGQEA